MAIASAQNQIGSNVFKTWLIMFFFSLFILGIVYVFTLALGYPAADAISFMGIALIMAGIMNFVSYYYSDKMVLALSNAQPVLESTNRELYHLVENLCIADGLPTPKIYIINDPSPNAFATGRDAKHAAIVFTTGILAKLNKRELEGVAAHELSHIKDRDTLLMSIVSILVGLIALLANWFFQMTWFRGRDRNENEGGQIFFLVGIIAAILAPIAATLIQLAISRRRELLADASGAFLTRDPEGLAKALQVISSDDEPVQEATPATAHLFIVNPFRGESAANWFVSLFNTHPPIKDRIKALHEMEGQFNT